MDVYFVRHGRTLMNLQGRLQGQGGFGLLPEGRDDARRAGERLAGKGVRLLYSSDQQRALETARIVRDVLGLRTPLRTSPRLREMHFGRMSGHFSRVVARRCPAWKRDPGYVFPGGGESYALVQARARAWLDGLARRRPAETVAVVTHGAWLRTLLADLRGEELARCLDGTVPHGLVARVSHDGGRARLRLLGDVTIFG